MSFVLLLIGIFVQRFLGTFRLLSNPLMNPGQNLSSVLLLIGIFFRGVLGTFPPVNNPPPIPGQGYRTLDIPSSQQFYIKEDISNAPPLPNIRDGPYQSDDDPRWFIQERQNEESSSSTPSEGFDRFYPNGEPAVGPVATPLPDDTYVAQPSSISNINPAESNMNSGIWILTTSNDNKFNPERWVTVQVQGDRVVEVLNQDLNPAVATDVVRSIATPLPGSGKLQNFPIAPGNIIQQIFIRTPSVSSSQKVLPNPSTLINRIPTITKIVDVSQENSKQIAQQPIAKYAYPFPSPAVKTVQPTFPLQKAFSVPPPLPPPVEGDVSSPKVIANVGTTISGTPITGSNVIVADKSALLQQLRHIWIPTSSRTGRFITIPLSNIQSGKSTIKTISLGTTVPVPAVSNTWVLKQDGLVPSFEQVKSPLPTPVTQTGKTVVQVDSPSLTQIISQYSPKNPPLVVNGVNVPTGIWPVKNKFTSSKTIRKTIVTGSPTIPVTPPQLNTVPIVKSIPSPLQSVVPQKSVPANQNIYSQPPVQLSPPQFQIINKKPYQMPAQLSIFSPKNPSVSAVPLSPVIVSQSKQPLPRIIQVNQFPTGSFYLLNAKIRPSVFKYPKPALLQQPKPGLVRIVQSKQPSVALQANQSPFAPKQGFIPLQPQIISPPVSTRFYSLPIKQIAAISPQKFPSRLMYPPLQGLRYIYPLNGDVKSTLIPSIALIRQSSPVKIKTTKSGSVPSSEGSSSESSGEKKEKEEGSEESKEKEKKLKKESEEKSSEIEKEGNVEESETESKESNEAAESQLHLQHLQPLGPHIIKPFFLNITPHVGNTSYQLSTEQNTTAATSRVYRIANSLK